jgi:hypothetical protein
MAQLPLKDVVATVAQDIALLDLFHERSQRDATVGESGDVGDLGGAGCGLDGERSARLGATAHTCKAAEPYSPR